MLLELYVNFSLRNNNSAMKLHLHCLLIDIQMKFQKDILNGFQLREQTRFYDKVQKEIIPKE